MAPAVPLPRYHARSVWHLYSEVRTDQGPAIGIGAASGSQLDPQDNRARFARRCGGDIDVVSVGLIQRFNHAGNLHVPQDENSGSDGEIVCSTRLVKAKFVLPRLGDEGRKIDVDGVSFRRD